MFAKKNSVSLDRLDTVIGKDAVFTGNLSVEGSMRIDGKFKGEILVQGDIVIGEGAYVEAVIRARNITVSGELRGRLDVTNKMEITSSGKYTGDIRANTFVIDEGGFFSGNCLMGEEQQATFSSSQEEQLLLSNPEEKVVERN